MKKKELKRNLTEARAEIGKLETQLAAEKRTKAYYKSRIDILMKDLEKEKVSHEWTNAAKNALEATVELEKWLSKTEIDKLEKEIDDIKRELALKTIDLNWFYEKGSEELWSINDFLNKMAEHLEKIANKRNLEGNSIKIDIIPIPLKDGLIRGYTSIVSAEEY